MPLDFTTLTPQIERIINLLALEYSQTPGSILTEDDLKCLLHHKLSRLPVLRKPVPTFNRHILGSHVHSELSWYDERGKLRIRPDITIIEPEHMSILHGYAPPALDPFVSAHHPFSGARPLPSKQCEIGGKAIILELKFARAGINGAVLRQIRDDFNKVMRLAANLERVGEGASVFSYLVVFNKLPQRLSETRLDNFVREHGAGPRHRILYRACRPRPANELGDRCYSERGDLVITNPPYLSAYARRGRGLTSR